MPENVGMEVSRVSWREVEEYLEECKFGVLPIASSCKEHGLHLPMNTDYLLIDWIIRQLLREHKLLVWPNIDYGYYPAFVNYPGSISLSADTFSDMVADTAQSILGHGVKTLVLLNAGISTISPLTYLCDRLEFSGKVKLCNIFNGKHFKVMEKQVAQQYAGGHADEIETSIMLAIAPDQVNMDKAESALRYGARPGVLQKKDTQAENYSASGVIGEPELATPEKGGRIVMAMLEDINELFAELIK